MQELVCELDASTVIMCDRIGVMKSRIQYDMAGMGRFAWVHFGEMMAIGY